MWNLGTVPEGYVPLGYRFGVQVMKIDVTPKTHQNNWTKIHCLWVVQNFLSRADFCCDPVPQTNWVRAVRTT
jgi:hypothetical protein